jgi:hypothetical protein
MWLCMHLLFLLTQLFLSKKNVQVFVDVFYELVLQVRKRDGSFYPFGSVYGMIKMIGRIVRTCIERKV